ncbi:MAG: matrixin family metalloprotease [Acidobacteriota bacterium]
MRLLRGALTRTATLLAALTCLASVAPAYYHWVFFTGRDAPFQANRMKFDVAALPDQTVLYFISKQGPAKMVEGDNFTALVSQIQRAADSWNVGGSALRVKFGGLQDIKSVDDTLAEQVTPGIDVVFDDDLPPGVLALTEPQTYIDIHYLGEKNSPGFVPILRSRLRLHNDLTLNQQGSYSDAFFLTMVHEFGHTLGLQHSMTSSVMSTSITRGTNKAHPLGADDVAGLAVLYPVPAYLATTGSIAGRVNVAGFGANLASVVALSLDGTAVGSMSLPDGSYKIEAVPPGEYLVYAHPLPPTQPGEADPAGIVPPKDLEREAFLATVSFETRFHPGTMDWTQATRVVVQAGKVAEGVDFGLLHVSSSSVYNVRMFAYLRNRTVTVHAPPLPLGFHDWLVFQGSGTTTPGTTRVTPGLKLSAIGDAARLDQSRLAYFADGYLQIVADALKADRATPVAVAITTPTDLYILPNAFSTVPSKHPLVSSVSDFGDSQGRQYATIAGDNLDADTQVLFDGAPALEVLYNDDGSLTAAAPPAAGEHHAAIEAFSPSGQTSGQLLNGAELPALFPYAAPPDPSITLTPGTLAAGTDGIVVMDGAWTDFLEGKTTVGFGTSDIVVRQMWVVNRNHLVLNVAVNPQAKPGNYAVTIATGLQLVTLGTSLQVLPADPKQVSLHAPVLNEATGLAGVPEGGTLMVRGTGLPESLNGWSMTVGGVRTVVTRGADGWLRGLVPPGSALGASPVELVAPSGISIPPVMMQIDAPPPLILSTRGPQGSAISVDQKLHAGDRVTLVVAGLADGLVLPDKSTVEVRLAGIAVGVDALSVVQAGTVKLEFLVPAAVPGGDTQKLTVGVGTRISPAVFVAVAPRAASEEDAGQ